MRKECRATQREMRKPRLYRVKVGNEIRVTSEKSIALGVKSEAFSKILQ